MSDSNGVAKAANLTTIVVASLTTFALCGAGATWLITARVAPIEAAVEINRIALADVKAELRESINREIERNNRLEREMGAVLKVDQLFEAGRLKLTE